MPKRKKKSPSSRRSSFSYGKLIRGVLQWAVILFVFLAIFDQAGSWGHWLYLKFNLGLGVLSPVLALYMLWVIGCLRLPKFVKVRFITFVGSILFIVSVAGFIHGFEANGVTAAKLGEGGGWLGQLVYSGLSEAFGSIISRLVLLILSVVALTMIFDQWILPLLQAKDEEEPSSEPSLAPIKEARVQVMGEIKPSPLGKWGFGRPAPKKAEVVDKPLLSPLKQATDWNYPPLTLLRNIEEKPQAGNIQKRMELIQKTLRDFGIEVAMTDVRIGPTVSQYTLRPADGVKLNAITARQDDLALALAAESLRVEAPIPGKSLVGVELPNEKKAMVGLRDILKSDAFIKVHSKLGFALGRDSAGEPVVADLTRMPHVLIAGATGSGKSVCINTLILSLLMNNSPDELKMILVDPKRVELNMYNGMAHLLTPVIHEPKDTVKALSWCVREMERRYKLLSSTGKKNIEFYNAAPELAEGRLPYIVVVIDELADLMMASAREVEAKIVRLAQMARAVGIHLVVATQRPSVDVITGLIKANIPTRIAFAVTSQVDSRTIIDQTGAEKLLGYGDMLYLSTDLGKPRRIQGVYCNEDEINSVVGFIRQQDPSDHYDPTVLEDPVESRFVAAGGLSDDEESLLREAYELVRKHRRASTSMLQTYMKLGYNKAKRIITAMEERGMIGPERGGKQREVYDIEGYGGGEEAELPRPVFKSSGSPYPSPEQNQPSEYNTSTGMYDDERTGIAPYPEKD